MENKNSNQESRFSKWKRTDHYSDDNTRFGAETPFEEEQQYVEGRYHSARENFNAEDNFDATTRYHIPEQSQNTYDTYEVHGTDAVDFIKDNSENPDYYGNDDDGYYDEEDIVYHSEPKTSHVKKGKWVDRLVKIGSIAVSLIIIVVMVFNTPIIAFKKLDSNGVMNTKQVSVLKYFKLWQPLVEQEGTITKIDSNDTEALDIREDVDEERDDGLELDQIIEGQYTLMFLGMDESGNLSDVNWVFQFDLLKGSLNVLQIPRDCYMPDYANQSTCKFNSIYHSGQEENVTPIQRYVDAVEENFCVTIDCYVKLNCVDLASIIDSIGGVPITLPEEIIYEADKVLPAGEQVLTGEQSEWFIRFRHGYSEGDIGRVKAQRIFLAAAMEKLISMSQTELYSAMEKIYKNKWIATDLSLEQISMLADYAAAELTVDKVNVFMVPGEGATHYGQSVYSIHKSACIDIINGNFRPYQNEVYPEESTIVELVEEENYSYTLYDDTKENLQDINDGDTEDAQQME